jgi:hypothetical protein
MSGTQTHSKLNVTPQATVAQAADCHFVTDIWDLADYEIINSKI